jgi:CPA2 family monovalent cation:H+ antiporter-2
MWKDTRVPSHDTPLIALIAIGFVLAFAFGMIAHRLRVSPLVGYLLAGIVIGPSTPGWVADQALAAELAEIGVILLMFAVGLHLSVKDLMAVRAIAIPGAIVQIAVATLLGMGLAWEMGWTLVNGFVFGLALSVASTAVLLRALQERHILESDRGHIAVGWLIVEDLTMVLILVLLPTVNRATSGGAVPMSEIVLAIAITLAKVCAFVAIMLVVGRRAVPWIMHHAAHTGSRELFRLAVYAVALGIAYGASALFGVSFALGAFFAGMVLAESKLAHRATEEAMPLRDAFAVLFFVSVGMLLHPEIIWSDPWAVLATVAIIVVGKSVASLLIVRAFGHPWSTGLTISASLAQIGEFSFILASLGVSLNMLPEKGRDLLLAGSIVSILLNPFIFAVVERRRNQILPAIRRTLVRTASHPPRTQVAAPNPPEVAPTMTSMTDHDVVVGYGRVGSLVGAGLLASGRNVLVFEERAEAIEAARTDGAEVVTGNASDPLTLEAANLPAARRLFVTIEEPFESGTLIQSARAANPRLTILARAHSDAAIEHLTSMGATIIVMGEREIARCMLEHAAANGG